ncbi:FAD-dependent monooxygenase [Roseibium sp.]|uniref:FAD-dependent monooxygenase n=1 Tax=Roseibium sp. TaxID=1936156 RepID=UPI003B510C84
MSETGTPPSPIVIAGAGIGGLTAALTLRRAGHEIVLIDKAKALSEVGAGLQLSPNACSVLDGFGLLQDLKALGHQPDNLRVWSGKTGDQISKVRLGSYLLERHGQPFIVIHRADLQGTLLKKVEATDGIKLMLGTALTDAKTGDAGNLVCTYQAGETTGTLNCKALIGADGVWSTVRRLIPNHKNARFSGQVAYRSTLPIDKIPAKWRKDSGLWLHRDSHLVHYPIRSGEQLNIVALATEDWQDETWSAPAGKDELLHRFKDWPTDIRNLLNGPERWLKWALCTVDANGPWTHGQIALLGDAAHAMLPYMAQGAAMAIEDAAELANHFPVETENTAAALRAYERTRKPRAERIQETGFKNAKTFHMSGLPATARDMVMKFSKPESLAARFDYVYGWKPNQALPS